MAVQLAFFDNDGRSRRTFGLTVVEMIGQSGLNREIIRAVCPDFVTVIMAEAFKSMAVVQVAWLMVFVMVGIISNCALTNLFQ